ncbi:MAG TPA: cobyrinate a,c-diamide synthase [Firmicutes bacterium]|nr:cobyrinate a,c-diamide synthase [Bacillota bacterium]
MMACLVAAPSSGSGKTAVTCALLALLARRGLMPCAFKCGPDYIDPMFHRSVLGVESHNLDLFFSSESFLRQHYARHCAGHQAAVCEGVMGFYDGVGGTTSQASAWHVAHTLDMPVLLVIRPRGASLTLAAQIRGLCAFREQSHIRGLFLNDCSPMLYRSLAPMLEKETGLPVLGYLPHREEAAFESRHLGLYTAGEIHDLQQRIGLLADLLEQNLDFARFSSLFCTPGLGYAAPISQNVPAITRLAIASDRAFCFCYEETKEALRTAGAELVPFSPLTDTQLPENTGGLYLPGGYPELYAKKLAENEPMLCAIRQAVENGMPTVAECGGFLYLGQHLEGSDGVSYPMAGVLPGDGLRKEKLTRFGYAFLTAQSDSLLFSAGDQIPVHEFHYWDSTENGAAFLAQKPVTGRSWSCGFATPTLYAGFPHLYGAGHSQWVRRFTHAANEYQKRQGKT